MRHFLIILLISLAACSQEDSTEPVPQVSDWRVSIALSEVNLPVFLHLAPDGSEAWLINGSETVHVPDISRDGDSWVLRFPTFNNTLVLNRTASGLSGSLTLVKRGYEQVMMLEAVPDRGFRFTENATADTDLTGRWDV